jgi:hypothetical protein
MALTKVTSGLISADASSVDLNIDAGTLYIDSTNNRVGIGTSSVDQKLHVEGSGTTAIKVETTADDYAIMQYKTSTSSLWQSFASPSNDYRIGISGVGDALTIDSSFNIGIGTSTPNTKIDVIGSTTNGSGVVDTIRMRNTGTTLNDGPRLQFTSGTSTSGAAIASQGKALNSADLVFYAGGNTERMRITSGGLIKASQNGTIAYPTGLQHEIRNSETNNWILRMVHGATSNPYGFEIYYTNDAPDNTANYFINCVDTVSNRFRVLSDGDVLNHDNSYGQISDEKLKQDITDAGSQWDDIKNLRVRNFKFKSDVEAYGDDAKSLIGLVAQEAELVSPHLVKDNPDLDEEQNDLGTVTKSIKYSVLYMKAIKALQEAMTRIEDLEARIQTLEGE